MLSPLGLNQLRLNGSLLQAPVQGRTGQVRDRRLQGIETIV